MVAADGHGRLLTAFSKECISKAGFTWNTHPLLLDAIKGGTGRKEREWARERDGSEEALGGGRGETKESGRDGACTHREKWHLENQSEMRNNVCMWGEDKDEK